MTVSSSPTRRVVSRSRLGVAGDPGANLCEILNDAVVHGPPEPSAFLLFDERLTDQKVVDSDALGVDDRHEVLNLGRLLENDHGVGPARTRGLNLAPAGHILAPARFLG
jgi:hypothetical protein